MCTRGAHMWSKCTFIGIICQKCNWHSNVVKATSMLLVYSEQLHTPQPYTVCVLEAATLHNVHMWPVLCSSQPSARVEVLLMCWIYMTLLFVYTYSLPSPCSFYRYRETRENDWREEGTYNIRTYVHVHVILQRLFVTL